MRVSNKYIGTNNKLRSFSGKKYLDLMLLDKTTFRVRILMGARTLLGFLP